MVEPVHAPVPYPRQHAEAITGRPLLLCALPCRIHQSGQTRITITYPHAEAASGEGARRAIRTGHSAASPASAVASELLDRPGALNRPGNGG